MANILSWFKKPAEQSQDRKRPLTAQEVKLWDSMFANRLDNGYSVKDAAKEADTYIEALRRRG